MKQLSKSQIKTSKNAIQCLVKDDWIIDDEGIHNEVMWFQLIKDNIGCYIEFCDKSLVDYTKAEEPNE